MSWLVLLSCSEEPKPRAAGSAETADTGSPAPLDSDGDGHPDEEDCAPLDALAFPEAEERCNGLDDDCDGEAEADPDGDGSFDCEDCDEARPDTHPGADDPSGDGVDTDCDGTDGAGTALPAPFWTGQTRLRESGHALASGDVDGDGCDELLVGEPGGWPGYPVEDAALLGIGCAPWADGWRSFTSDHWSMGESVELAAGVVAVFEEGWASPRGRVLIFDESFGPDAAPLLEVRGGGNSRRRVDLMTLLGEPAQWLLLGRGQSLDFDGQYYLVDLQRRGLLDLELEEPDLTLTIGSTGKPSGLPGDVGDRDGGGEVDLGLMVEAGGSLPLRFFPAVTGGHTDDAPEAWRDGASGQITDQHVRSGGDLDGDGRSEAVYASLSAEGHQIAAGRAFLLPWLGAGEYDVDMHAPTRIDGELPYDATGYDSEVADLDGDGQDDLLLGAPGYWTLMEGPGKVLAFAGPLGPGTLTAADAAAVFVGEQRGDHAGAALAVGDYDGDGQPDLALGAPFADRDGLTDAGAVYLLLDPL